uniref:Uncharacterized protein n=1 Tax=Mycoplasma anserisalpingitidis TaxID=519450 RepID=A0A8F2DEX1_9MOLU|nr:hypothetical protein [Mycoplasma anserisalpingitidis]QWS78812.1 hypothetical protein [Mycoplasma anserisalpingitidis]QWS78826.1 hypothetical protein [Mycoplasma anserisalpingitidis]
MTKEKLIENLLKYKEEIFNKTWKNEKFFNDKVLDKPKWTWTFELYYRSECIKDLISELADSNMPIWNDDIKYWTKFLDEKDLKDKTSSKNVLDFLKEKIFEFNLELIHSNIKEILTIFLIDLAVNVCRYSNEVNVDFDKVKDIINKKVKKILSSDYSKTCIPTNLPELSVFLFK